MTLQTYRAELMANLKQMTDSTTGLKTWTAEDVNAIKKGQTYSVLREVMKYNSPAEYAEILSM